MGKALTEKGLSSIKPVKSDQWLTDAGKRGEGKLLFRVSPDGGKRFYYRRPVGFGSRVPVSLAPYDSTGSAGYTLRQARDKVAELEQLRRAIKADPIAHLAAEARRKESEEAQAREAQRQAAEEAKRGTFGDLLDAYVRHLRQCGKERSAKEVDGAFTLHVRKPFPDLIDRKAGSITRGEVLAILTRMTEKEITRGVNKMRAFLMAAFNLPIKAEGDPRAAVAMGQDFAISANPVALTKRIREFDRAADRVLKEAELRAFWNGLDKRSAMVRDALQLALRLGGQRLAQLLRVTVHDVDLDAGIMRLRDGKGQRLQPRLHALPIPEEAKAIVEHLTELNPGKAGLFSSDGERPMHPDTLTAAVREVSDILVKEGQVQPFSMRDLRRTCETMLAAMGISKDMRAQLQSHGLSGVQDRHYDRHDYLAEKRAALAAWNAHLTEIVENTQAPSNLRCVKLSDNVRRLRRPGRTI